MSKTQIPFDNKMVTLPLTTREGTFAESSKVHRRVNDTGFHITTVESQSSSSCAPGKVWVISASTRNTLAFLKTHQLQGVEFPSKAAALQALTQCLAPGSN